MERKSKRSIQLVAIASIVLAVFTWAPSAAAEDIQPSNLKLSSFVAPGGGVGLRSYLGEWVLSVEVPDNPQYLLLKFMDVDGKMAATIQAAAQTQAQVVTDITESSLALKLRYSANFGETESAMVLIVRLLDRSTLTGSISDELGLLAPQFEVSPEHETLGLGLYRFRVRGNKGGKLPGRALLDIAGNVVKISYTEIRSDTEDHEQLEKIKNGEVFEVTSARATKLFTDADLQFGDVIIRTENAGKNYPGVYSLWLKKVEEGWNLVFNEHADVWGTMYESEMDVAEVPLEHTTLDKGRYRFTIDLEERGNGGLLKLAWGKDQWTVPFILPQYPQSAGTLR